MDIEIISHYTKIINFLKKNEEYFINILDKIIHNNNYIPNKIFFYPFYNNNKIDSLISYTSSGHYYLYLKDKYIKDTAKFLNNNIQHIYSLYGECNIVKLIDELLIKHNKDIIIYHVMKLIKDDYIANINKLSDYNCIKCNITHYSKLKELQIKYHKEEVYTNSDYYPYLSEMNNFKDILKNKINFAVYSIDENKKFVSKANVNGETFNSFQLGGIYTLDEYRNKGLSKLCLTNMLNYIFDKTEKKSILLFVKKENLNAINLYKKFGFKTIYDSALYYY